MLKNVAPDRLSKEKVGVIRHKYRKFKDLS